MRLVRVAVAEAYASLGHLRWSKSNKRSSRCWRLRLRASSGALSLLIVRVIGWQFVSARRTRVVLLEPGYEALAMELMRARHLNHDVLLGRAC